MKISREVAFRILTKNRETAAKAAHKFGAFFLRKGSGGPYKHPQTTHETQEQAHASATYLSSINPGSRLVVLPLDGETSR